MTLPADASTPLLAVQGFRKHYAVRRGFFGRRAGAVQAVDGVSLTVRQGEVLGIVGESGCGKSTLARLLMRLIEPDGGRMLLDGHEVAADGGVSLAALRSSVQMVFQDSYSSLNPRMSVCESIAFTPRVGGTSAASATAQARALLDQVGLSPLLFAHRYPHELSGGQRQRVNIARALAVSPRVVVLDEPVSALDKSVEAQVLNLLVALQESQHLTYVLISHDLNVVRYISDHVAVMYLGRIVETGAVEDIFDAPRHPYTRALLASAPSLDPRKRTREAPLSGDPPNPIDPPSGCRFRTRCPFAEEVCAAHDPQAVVVHRAHSVCCHMSDAGSGHSRASSSPMEKVS
ncbi:ABC transporter ATP-binding protein [Variovorax sp. J31P207]|uniref:ABC transporter ATP-binding protein n=1 Tax=Variovorax sp. J31P207 TaxID=3053510 RepID=UPI002574CAB4|nr:ABC transporter ATP-binding protein [Variovorax sp. J31P207]MDM0069941.1 ABC transporter ATP-binding protein [Variovorax sp. J31P207]